MKRVHTYKLYRETKTKALNITTSLIMVASSLGGMLPVMFTSRALAAPLDVCTSVCAYSSIQAAVNAANTGDTITVAAGTYIENVDINKSVTVQGAGAATTKIVATDANATPLTFSGNNATVSGFTITHSYTPGELSAWTFNNNDVTFNQLTSGNTLKDSTVTLGRNGVYLNNSHDNVITGNTITDNRTGINMTNDLHGTQITNNTISHNWTEGLVTYSATATLPTDYSTVTVSGNTFDQNWYEEITVKDAGSSNGTLNVTNNTFTDSPVTYSTSADASLNEPGFTAQRPVELGGTATQPVTDLPTLRIYNSPSATLLYTSAPTGLRFENPNIACGGATNVNHTTAAWDAAPGAVSYDYHVDGPAGLTYDANLTAIQNSGSFGVGAEGTYTFKVRSVYTDGSKSAYSSGCSITYDHTVPAAPTLVTPANNGYETTDDFYFTWTDSSDSGSPVIYEFQSDSSSSFTSPWDSIANGNSEQNNLTSPKIHSTGAPDGTYYWRVRAIDAAGNKSDWSDTRKMTIDSNAPVMSITNPTANQLLKGRTVSISGTATDNDFNYYYCYVSNVNGHEYGTRDAACNTTWHAVTAAGPLGTVSLPNNLADGNYVVHLIGYDKAGNHTEATQPFVLDNTRPTVAFTAPADFSTPFASGPNVTVNASDTNGLSALVLHVYNSSNTLLGVCGSATAAQLAAGSVSCDLSGLADGTYHILAGANDKAGNNTTINSGNFTIDSTAPSTPVAIPGAGNYTSVQLVGLGSDDATGSGVASIYYTTDGSTPSNTNGTLYTGSFTVSNSETVKAIAYDNADNASSVLTADYTITLPVAPSFTAAAFTTTANPQNGGNGGNGTAAPQVLGDSTTTPTDTSTGSSTGTNGKVKGDSIVKLQNASNKNGSSFLGLGWWWLAVLAAVGTLWFFLLYRRSDNEK